MVQLLTDLGVPLALAVILALAVRYFLFKKGDTVVTGGKVDAAVKYVVYLIGAGVLVAILYGCSLVVG